MKNSISGLCLFLITLVVSGQTRINDKDLEHLMQNLKEDAKAFRKPFDSALEKSTIRRTGEAKDAEHLAALFEKQTEQLLDNFKQTKKGDTYLTAVQSTSQQLRTVINKYLSDSVVAARWNRIQAELQQVLSAYGMGPADTANENPRGATSGSVDSLSTGSCSAAIGPVRANQLVQECLEVSPATHPPCNAQNSCSLIVSEIKRSCALLGKQAPKFCDQY